MRENLLFASGLYGLGPRVRRRRIGQLLERLELADVEHRLARDISGGMQRRVALAATLIHQPDLIVLDEPTAGLDPLLREAVWQMLEELRQGGATLVVTTQYITETERGDRILLIRAGALVASGTPTELRHQAYGGEVVRLRTSTPQPELAAELAELETVRAVRQLSADDFELIVASAQTAIPRLLEELHARNYQVDEIRQVQASLDSVFVELVQRSSSHDETRVRSG